MEHRPSIQKNISTMAISKPIPSSFVLATSLIATLSVSIVILLRRSREQQLQKTIGSSSSGYEKLIGNTPLVRLDRLSEFVGRSILVKMESLNPGGTGKDRAALCMLQDAEASGKLPASVVTKLAADKKKTPSVDVPSGVGQPSSITNDTNDKSGSTDEISSLYKSIASAMTHSRSGGLVVEGTSGSTGISLATLCAARGHACLVVLPDDQAPEKCKILKALGATVRIVPTAAISNPQHYVNIARRLADLAQSKCSIPAVFVNQFENLANYQAHYDRTGPEIWQASRPHAFCMSSGTGGTIAGVAKYLKEQSKDNCRVVLVDPPGSALYHAIEHGIAYAPQQRERSLKRHRYDTLAEGIGLDRLTQNLTESMDCIDTAIRVSDQEAVDMAHFLLRTEGLWVGSSSAMNVVGAVRTALDLPTDSRVVTVICDAGQRHVTRFWNKDFILEWGLKWPGDDGDERIPACLKEMFTSGATSSASSR
jgi:cysteine synthase A